MTEAETGFDKYFDRRMEDPDFAAAYVEARGAKPAKFLRLLPKTREVKAKIAKTKRGGHHSEETKAKISASVTGFRHTDEAKAKISAARRFASSLTPEQRAERKAFMAETVVRDYNDVRFSQWKLDQMTCTRLGLIEALKDVTRSSGYANKRRIKNIPGVSNGFSHPEKKILWAPPLPIEKL